MIFNEMNNIGVSHESVKESPYELGIGGALMHVYENECNYNAFMKAAALSEMKYYTETGGDLFVHEAGAFSRFLQTAKDFFKKVIEKIKSIAKKFIAKINQFTMKDKEFVKKYKNELVRRDLTDFEFKGYEFPNFEGTVTKTLENKVVYNNMNDSDKLNDIIEENRGHIVGEGKLTESEFRDVLKEKIYGDKTTLDNINIRDELKIILDTNETIKAAKKKEKEIVDYIEKNIIKNLESVIKTNEDNIDNNIDDAGVVKAGEDTIKYNDAKIKVLKAYCNDVTVYYGAYLKGLADKNRQAKAICVKALSYKHEAATVYEGSYDDIFAGVQIV